MAEQTVAADDPRFWDKVDVRGFDECWMWKRSTNLHGYGKVRIDGRLFAAHRLSFELHNGPVSDGLHVCHKCDVPGCVNPAHLFLGTMKDNVRDMHLKGRHSMKRASGTDNGSAKLTPAKVRRVHELIARGCSHRAIAAEMGVCQSTIWSIRRGKTWRIEE